MKTNLISIWVCAFTLMACGASRETVVNQEKADWGQLSFRETLQTQVVPMSEANLAIPITALQDLPQAAVFHQSSGQANVSVRLVHDTLFVESRCDSLMQLVRIPLRQSDAIGISIRKPDQPMAAETTKSGGTPGAGYRQERANNWNHFHDRASHIAWLDLDKK